MTAQAKPQPFDPAVYVHSPAALGVMHVEHYEYLLEHPGITWGVECMDRTIIPMRPGDMGIICGRPGSGKTSLLARQAKRVAMDIADREAQTEECVIYVSWEQHAEELEAYFQTNDRYTHTDYAWARVNVEDVRRQAMSRARLPLWIVGHSRKYVGRQFKALTLDLVFEAVESMVNTYEHAPRPVLLCFDYAQLIPPDFRYRDTYRQVKNAMVETKNLALRIGCPVLVAAQAKREVDGYNYPIPLMSDAQESSGIEQHPDKFFGIWRPWRTMTHNSTFDFLGHTLTVTPDLFIMRMNKQRGDDGDRIFILHFGMAELELAAMEVEEPEPLEF